MTLRNGSESERLIADLTHDDWAVIYKMTLDASPEIHAANVKHIRKRYPAEPVESHDRLCAQPYATWCKVHRIVVARRLEGHRESHEGAPAAPLPAEQQR